MLAAINAALNERRIESHFVSMLYVLWDDARHVMHVANSGQPRPIQCRRGQTHVMESTGLPLGLLEDAEYDEITLQAHPGDVFVFFSDGIIDAQNRNDELWGRTNLEEVVRRNCGKSAEEVVDRIFDAMKKHCKGVPPFDDETVVVLKIKDHGQTQSVEAARTRKRTSPALRSV
jgi:sigma-B regulation protein RsbU (phosphoserine phosphatase)